MNNVIDPGTTFAERLREAVQDNASRDGRRMGRLGRHRSEWSASSLLKPVANPRRVRSEELFVDRVRRALD